MYTFSWQTLDELHKAGWTPQRQIDTAEYERLLREEGYVVHPVVVEFLRSFGGLKMTHPQGFVPKLRETFHFDIGLAISHTFSENVQGDAEDVGSPVCLIGQMASGDLWLTMDASGNVYASDLSVRFLGSSGSDAIEALCTKRPSIFALFQVLRCKQTNQQSDVPISFSKKCKDTGVLCPVFFHPKYLSAPRWAGNIVESRAGQ